MTLNYDEIVARLANAVHAATGRAVAAGALPPAGGLAVALQQTEFKRDMDGGGRLKMRLVVNAKNADQQQALRDLEDAHTAALTLLDEGLADYQLTGISLKSGPAYVGTDTQGYHIYGSGIEVRMYVRGG